MAKPREPELVVEYERNGHRFRIYRTREGDRGWRYHFGLPKAALLPIRGAVEGSLGLGEPHWAVDGEFWVFTTPIVAKGPRPRAELRERFLWILGRLGRVIDAIKRTGAER